MAANPTTVDAYAALLGGSIPARKSRKERAEPTPVPDNLKASTDAVIRGRARLKDLEEEVKLAEEDLKAFGRLRYCEDFARLGSKPESVAYASDAGVVTYIQTTRTYLTPERLAALRDLAFPIDSHIEVGGMELNLEAVRKLGLESKLLAALASVASAEDLKQCLVPKVTAKASLWDAIAGWAAGTGSMAGTAAQRIGRLLGALSPVVQLKSVEGEE